MRRSAVRIILAICVVIVTAIAGGVIWTWDAYKTSGPLKSEVALIVPKGAGVQEIARLLQEAGVIEIRICLCSGHATRKWRAVCALANLRLCPVSA